MRTILHIDLDAFFCAVEEQLNSDLAGIAFAVGGQADSRGVVASCSYPARLFGVRSAMPMATAKRLCPELVVVPANFKAYREMSGKVMDILHDTTPLVEPLSIDEAFMDVTGLPGTPAEIATRLQDRIRSELDLPCSLGVATNKLIAKTANNIGKGRVKTGDYPRAIEVVPPGKEATFMAPLPIRELWGVGPKTAEHLHRMNLKTIGDIARTPEASLVQRFGKHGADLWRRANGLDDRPVETEQVAKSISKETTFSQDVRDRAELQRTIRMLADGVGYRLRKAGMSGTTVKIKLRWSDFTTLTRQSTLNRAIDQDELIFKEAMVLFERHWPPGKPIRLIGVGISGLQQGSRQLSLFEAPAEAQNQQLQDTLDALRQRFGEDVIQRGSNLPDH